MPTRGFVAFSDDPAASAAVLTVRWRKPWAGVRGPPGPACDVLLPRRGPFSSRCRGYVTPYRLTPVRGWARETDGTARIDLIEETLHVMMYTGPHLAFGQRAADPADYPLSEGIARTSRLQKRPAEESRRHAAHPRRRCSRRPSARRRPASAVCPPCSPAPVAHYLGALDRWPSR